MLSPVLLRQMKNSEITSCSLDQYFSGNGGNAPKNNRELEFQEGGHQAESPLISGSVVL